MKMQKKTFQFTLILNNAEKTFSSKGKNIFQRPCYDALIQLRAGNVYVEFQRKAASLEEAILSAFNDIDTQWQTKH